MMKTTRRRRRRRGEIMFHIDVHKILTIFRWMLVMGLMMIIIFIIVTLSLLLLSLSIIRWMLMLGLACSVIVTLVLIIVTAAMRRKNRFVDEKNICKYSSPQSANIYPHNPTGEDKRQWPHRRTGPPPRSETTPAPWSNILILLIKCRSPTRAWTRWRSPTSPTCPPTWTRTCPTTWTRVCPPTCRRTCPPSTWVQAIQETSSRRWGDKRPRQGRNFWGVVKIRWTVPPERAPFSLAKSDIGLMVILEECSCWTRCNPLSLLLRRAFLIVVCQFERGGF